ncbi:MAG: phosphatidate cytidylyltransferase [Barnesiella sp.]
MKSLLLRSITGALFVAVIISAIFFGETSFLLIFSAIVAYALFEFYHLLGKMHKEKKIIILLDIIAGTYLFIQIFQIAASGSILTPFTLTPYWFYLVIRLIMQLYIKDENPIESWAHSFLGHIYIALPLGLLGNIAFSQDIYNSTFLPVSGLMIPELFLSAVRSENTVCSNAFRLKSHGKVSSEDLLSVLQVPL